MTSMFISLFEELFFTIFGFLSLYSSSFDIEFIKIGPFIITKHGFSNDSS